MANKKQQTRRKQQQPRRARRRPRRAVRNPYLRMLVDPCSAEVVPGIYGTSDGLTAKFRYSTTNNSSANAGYILWIPQLCNVGSANGTAHVGFNVFGYAGSQGSSSPVNVTSNPLGTSTEWAQGSSGFCIPDPGAAFLQGDTCQVQRMISACIKMTYMGAMNDSSGQVGYITDLDPRSLIHGGSNDGPPSVNQMFNLCAKTDRIGVGLHENKYSAITDNDGVYHTINNEGWQAGVDGGPTTSVSSTAARFRYPAFGFCWRGVTSSEAGLVFEFIKNVEWRPEPVAGLVQPPPVHTGGDKRTGLLAYLDQAFPNWATSTLDGVARLGPAVAEAAFTGSAAPLLERALRGASAGRRQTRLEM